MGILNWFLSWIVFKIQFFRQIMAGGRYILVNHIWVSVIGAEEKGNVTPTRVGRCREERCTWAGIHFHPDVPSRQTIPGTKHGYKPASPRDPTSFNPTAQSWIQKRLNLWIPTKFWPNGMKSSFLNGRWLGMRIGLHTAVLCGNNPCQNTSNNGQTKTKAQKGSDLCQVALVCRYRLALKFWEVGWKIFDASNI